MFAISLFGLISICVDSEILRVFTVPINNNSATNTKRNYNFERNYCQLSHNEKPGVLELGTVLTFDLLVSLVLAIQTTFVLINYYNNMSHHNIVKKLG
jgi:hypothetical protein